MNVEDVKFEFFTTAGILCTLLKKNMKIKGKGRERENKNLPEQIMKILKKLRED